MRRFLLLLLAVFLCVQSVQAQIQVNLDIKRRFFMMYEPIVATVTIKNLTGRDLLLADTDTQSWFGFQVNREDGQLVSPLNPDYKLNPLTIPMGGTVKRSIVVNTLFPVRELGMYRIRAHIYFSPQDKYYQSQLVNIEISEGKTLWQQTVGVPDGVEGAGGQRKVSMLSFRQTDYTYLYTRIEDAETGMIYATMPLGRVIVGVEPDIQMDLQNRLHVLQVVGPKVYLYSQIGLNGELLSQDQYASINKTRPYLRRDRTGLVTVSGGELQALPAASGTAGAKGAPVPAKLSDRPVMLPAE
jgi:hypothetical protein